MAKGPTPRRHYPSSILPASKRKAYLQRKRTLKFLSVCHDPRLQRYILKHARDDTYKSICNAVVNIAQNPEVRRLPRQLKHSLTNKNNRKLVSDLLSPKVAIKRKREIIQSGSGLFLGTVLPLLLSTAFSTLGSAFLGRARNRLSARRSSSRR